MPLLPGEKNIGHNISVEQAAGEAASAGRGDRAEYGAKIRSIDPHAA